MNNEVGFFQPHSETITMVIDCLPSKRHLAWLSKWINILKVWDTI